LLPVRSRLAQEPAVPMFNRRAIHVKVIVSQFKKHVQVFGRVLLALKHCKRQFIVSIRRYEYQAT
jgi:hypothetical protein